MTKQVPVSVVINTADRAKYLGDTLEGLRQQTYENFEVIVVNGPSEDNTEEVAKSFNIRYYTAPYNLSVSRNIGIKAAAGEIILFIDDDAVPSRTWIEEIVAAYKDPEVGAAGGFVYHTGNAHFQFCYGAINMWGMPRVEMEPTEPFDFNTPHSDWYNINIGTNASYRRSYLIEIGGFDEEYEYYHDESDVCVRMIDAGYRVAQINGALVHHKMAPSSRRKSWKSVVNWNSMVKNGIYFSIKYTNSKASLTKRIVKPGWEERHKFKETAKGLKRREINLFQFIYKIFGLFNAMSKGYKRGFSKQRKMLSDYVYTPKNFMRYKTDSEVKATKEAKKIILVSQGFPPNATDGIARYNHTLAKALARQGHHVSVITKSLDGRDQICYQDGFWVYFHNSAQYLQSVTGYGRIDNIVAHSKSVYNTAKSINLAEGGVDVILTPLWDVEGLALIRHKIAPTYVTLMSPLRKVVETQWAGVQDASIEYVYELEEYVVRNADAVMAISQAVADTIAEDYSIDWRHTQGDLHVIQLGVESDLQLSVNKKPKKKDNSKIEILYVGRFERRKGIDLLLDVIPRVMEAHDNVQFRLIGNSEVYDVQGVNFWDEFRNTYKHAKWFKDIKKEGYVTDEQLADAYENCDIFIAPSRYESFGLIFIEAMAHAKPVIGTRIGGIPETVKDNATGLLFELDDKADLVNKINQLIVDKKLRSKLGEAGYKAVTEKFSAERMANNFLSLLLKK